ncbi:MAM and LDL-receptor class A domain-containing protein 1-like isoform X2 [Mytilus californianus]|uniref:MAM and LDL-receptor class A domain-containing protein 1-like isoform X2 n=1 Tax=Mytilus californianus TaxID=6549 RepID=UPI0022481C73|nr:MAM and LDL-receptor class A domain-containing protein 1-like isoform X2 [Mytilus californianus]
MKTTLFFVFVLWNTCLITSHKIPAKYLRDAKSENYLNELEQLLKEQEYEDQDQSETEEGMETSLETEEGMETFLKTEEGMETSLETEEGMETSQETEEEMKAQENKMNQDEQEYSDAEDKKEKDQENSNEKEMNEIDKLQGRQVKFGQKLPTSETRLDRPDKSQEYMPIFTDKEMLLIERKIKDWRKGNEEEKEEDTEELPIDNPENIDPNDPLSNLLEGMEIENKGKLHLVQGLHPEDSAKTFGDSHDSHRLIPEQIAKLELKKTVESDIRYRNFDTDTDYLWKDGIVPYRIYNMSTSSVTVIDKAIQQFHDFTCIKWISTTDTLFNPSALGHQNFVTFINEQGCWSYVGNVFLNGQYLSLQEPGCVSVSTAVHEMLHAMGGHHEQSRSDRDNYVTIEWPNVQQRWNGLTWVRNNNMEKYNTQDNNPYDAESSMQYSLFAFSTNGKQTIKFKDQRLEFLADSADGLEFYDIQDVTDAYKCADHCTNRPNCQNGGFVNFQCTCTCPEHLTGATCEQTVSNSQTCGGVITLGVGEERFIQSPNYPANYPTGLECTWLIKGTANNIVRASVQYMDISSDAACNHWLEYRYNLLGQKGPKKCGTNFVADAEIWDSTLDELSNAMMIIFDSNTFSTKPAATGFSIKVQSIGKGCVNAPCVYGTCNSLEGTSGYTCTCNQGISGTNCDVLTTSSVFECSFEYGERCIFENEANHQLNWEYMNKGTPSPDTGPDVAHKGYQYVYIEATGANIQAGDKAVKSTNLQLPNVDHCMTFWYHMKGTHMGTLNIYSEGQNTAKSNIWSRSGAQGNFWIKGEVNVPAMIGRKISIEAVRGSYWSSDIAIDDISLTPGSCANPASVAPTNSQTTTQPTTITFQPTGGSQACTFEVGASCFLVEATDDEFDWTPNYGETTSSKTGPASAFEGVMYKYIEVSSPVRSNSVARLMSSSSLNGGDHCLTFAYHMFGADTMGDLKISTGVTAPENELFKQSGNHGDQWNKGMVEFTSGARMKLFIEANKGTTYRGDIALDDIELKSGNCYANPVTNGPTNSSTTTRQTTTKLTTTQPTTTKPTTTQPITTKTTTTQPTTTKPNPTQPTDCRSEYICGFEGQGKCVFENIDQDDFDWDFNTGSTSSSSTGPDNAYEGSGYIYTEMSSPRSLGDRAVLSTVNTRLAGKSTHCLQFYLHMYGEPGMLDVKYGESGALSSVWSMSGDQGDQWKHHQVELPPSFSNPVILFEASRGSSFKSDIALDSVKLSVGECPAISACITNPCINGGRCNEDGSTARYTCICMTGWSGDSCDVKDLSSFSCGFETDAPCIFKNSSQDDFDWTWNSFTTPSPYTGPDIAAVGTYYLYTEASDPRKFGDKAVLTTEATNLQVGGWCLSFQYHMKGRGIGTLEVFFGDKTSSLTSIWKKTGEQPDPDQWKTSTLELPQITNPVITIEASRGSSYSGDIAIDDLTLKSGGCFPGK